MSGHPLANHSPSNFDSIFRTAFNAYKNRTGHDITSHPLAAWLKTCDSPDAILAVLRAQVDEFDRSRRDDERLTKWLNPTVNVLYAFSATLGEGVGLVFSPAKVIFTGFGVLLLASKDVAASHDVLIDIFERIENFFKRLGAYTEVPQTTAMTDVIVKIMVEVLSIFAIATKEIRQGRAKKFVKKLVKGVGFQVEGVNKVVQGVDGKVDGVYERVQVVDERVKGVDERVHGVGEGLQCVDYKVQAVDDRVKQVTSFDVILRNWISPPDPSINYNTACGAHHEAGSGKSILSSVIIRDIEDICNAGFASMAYFYFDFKDTAKQDSRALVSSLLIQLSDQSDTYCDILHDLYSTHRRGSVQPNDDALTQCLKTMLVSLGQTPIYVILDCG
ncbi:hypothetical protein EDB92DRAFT_2116823 [Lactarius akahatsu]|uniref:Fungal STAND N-terminal Goodbye domain-containing protein n=1 Tax=Lactarius akahatsu TaxID=416441 RepID=A0AAD4LB82_9AGAM|nr:hypothetical protein EDB92DRAFT_2116823 [Lactarius akahatsu]